METIAIVFCVFLMGMSKGGFPVGAVAIPIMVLAWPGEQEPTKAVVAFALPLLCVMDVVSLAFYRKHVLWRRILPLLPGWIAGIAVGSIFISSAGRGIDVPDRWLKFGIGVIGISFVLFQLVRGLILRNLEEARPGLKSGSIFGFAAGVTSTMAHAAGPIADMYLLRQKLDKMKFAATKVAFFLCLNLMKLAPFYFLGRFNAENLELGAKMLPVIPFGVAAGYGLVRILKQKHYIGVIYFILFATSVALVSGALSSS